jgi:hypothetical protein
MNRTDLLALLAELGIPHDLSIRELEARYGVRKSTYYDWPVIRISDARPLVPGQVEAPDFQPRLQPDLLPPPDFFALVSVHTDARMNHAATLASLGEFERRKRIDGEVFHPDEAAHRLASRRDSSDSHLEVSSATRANAIARFS